MKESFKILLKFPTRERPQKALQTVANYINLAADNDNIVYLISIDTNDRTMNNPVMIKRFESLHNNVICIVAKSKNKIHAYNRDIDLVKKWDIVVAASDDMVCVCKGWDNVIRSEMFKRYPDTDGILHFNDGYVKERLITLPILGRKYYDRFSYIYHYSYVSLWCDNEQMEVAKQLKRITYNPKVLFKHEHFTNCSYVKRDALIMKTESYFHVDQRNFNKRKRVNFEL